MLKRYEGLFILNTAGKEEGPKDILEKISAEITAAGGKVETVQKMDKRNFTRVANKKHSSGFYVNIVFNAAPPVIASLRNKFAMNSDVFRVLFSESAESRSAK